MSSHGRTTGLVLAGARRLLFLLVGAIVGLVAGYYAGALVGCRLIMPGSNLCGLPVIVTVPAGLLAGGGFGWRYGRRPADPVAP
jgi:hypothetical protein